jgi:hypothetical protein
MKWRNHALMAGSIAVMMNLSPAEIMYCAAGAGLPDQIEKIGKVRIIAHRTWTHELLLWLVPLLLLLIFPQFVPGIPEFLSIPAGPEFREIFTVRTAILLLPGVLHLAGDVMTPMGILVGGRKVSLGLFSTGQAIENVVAGLFVFAALAYQGGLSQALIRLLP